MKCKKTTSTTSWPNSICTLYELISTQQQNENGHAAQIQMGRIICIYATSEILAYLLYAQKVYRWAYWNWVVAIRFFGRRRRKCISLSLWAAPALMENTFLSTEPIIIVVTRRRQFGLWRDFVGLGHSLDLFIMGVIKQPLKKLLWMHTSGSCAERM